MDVESRFVCLLVGHRLLLGSLLVVLLVLDGGVGGRNGSGLLASLARRTSRLLRRGLFGLLLVVVVGGGLGTLARGRLLGSGRGLARAARSAAALDLELLQVLTR